MAILAGIDEAGFGPLLGPLVVSSSVFRTDADMSSADLWQVLRKSVGRTRSRLVGRLLIADSKKAYKRDEGLRPSGTIRPGIARRSVEGARRPDRTAPVPVPRLPAAIGAVPLVSGAVEPSSVRRFAGPAYRGQSVHAGHGGERRQAGGPPDVLP